MPTDRPPTAVLETLRELRRRTRTTERQLQRLAADTRHLDARVAQLLALQDEEPGLGARLDRLSGVLDPARISRHVAEVVDRAELVAAPVPHAVIAPLFPGDVHDAAVDAIPPRGFFGDAGSQRLELALPPAVAPTRAVVVWRFLTELAVSVLTPALVARFAPVFADHVRRLGVVNDDTLRFTGSHGRLVLRRPGYQARSRRAHPGHLLTVVIGL